VSDLGSKHQWWVSQHRKRDHRATHGHPKPLRAVRARGPRRERASHNAPTHYGGGLVPLAEFAATAATAKLAAATAATVALDATAATVALDATAATVALDATVALAASALAASALAAVPLAQATTLALAFARSCVPTVPLAVVPAVPLAAAAAASVAAATQSRSTKHSAALSVAAVVPAHGPAAAAHDGHLPRGPRHHLRGARPL
jgi:hypothetical protein